MFIAEIGLNYKGSETRALKMLRELVKTDINAITLQLREPEYYKKGKLCPRPLSKGFYKKAISFVHKNNKLIGFAIADKDMIPFLNKAGADFWKTLSMSILDNGLMKELQKTNKLLFVSTGLSDEGEIIEISKRLKNTRFIHTQLSHKTEDANLRVITNLKKLTNKEIAFGLHCSNPDVLFASVAFTPSDTFFYVKDNPREKFPDDEHAIIISEIDRVLERLKIIAKALGTGTKEKMENKIKKKR